MICNKNFGHLKWVFISLFSDLVFEPEDITSETGLRDVNDMARILRKLFIDGNYYCLFFCVPIFLGNGKGQFSRGWNVNYVAGNCLPNKVWRDYRSRLLVWNFIIIFWWSFVVIVIIIFQCTNDFLSLLLLFFHHFPFILPSKRVLLREY